MPNRPPPPWLAPLLARHASRMAACSTDAARIGVLRAACEESAARARLDALEPILGGALLMRDEALADVAAAEASCQSAGECGADGAPLCGSIGEHGRALLMHGRCVACAERAGFPTAKKEEAAPCPATNPQP